MVQGGIENEEIHVPAQAALQGRCKLPLLQQAQGAREIDTDIHVAPQLGSPTGKGAEKEGEIDEIIACQKKVPSSSVFIGKSLPDTVFPTPYASRFLIITGDPPSWAIG